jgi:hypothetical protein
MRQPDAAQERRSRKPRRIADHAATDGDNCAAAIGAGANERFVNARDRLEIFETLAVRNQNRLSTGCNVLKARAMQSPDNRTGDNESPFADIARIEECRKLLADSIPIQIAELREPVSTSTRTATRVLVLNAQCSMPNAQC